MKTQTDTTYMTTDIIESLDSAAREAFDRWAVAVQNGDEAARDTAFADFCRLTPGR